MTLLDRARTFVRASYSHAAAIGVAITGALMALDPGVLQAGWLSMPLELRALIPAKLASYISLTLLSAVWLFGTARRVAMPRGLGLMGAVGAPIAVGPLAIKLLHHFEQCRLVAYLCQAGKWTIGWGMTYYPDGRRVKAGDHILAAEADWMFAEILERDFARAVRAAIGAAPTTPAQFGAMVALAYNIGSLRFAWSSVARHHRAGRTDQAAAAFALWNKVRGKVSDGLVRRRAAEAALYRSDFKALADATHGQVVA